MAGAICMLRLQYMSLLSANDFHLKAGMVEIDAGAKLTAAAEDRIKDTTDNDVGKGQNGAGGKMTLVLINAVNIFYTTTDYP